jgi:hypothetical protein
MSDELSPKELAELTKARKPSTKKQLTEKARIYILEQAGIRDKNATDKSVHPDK